MATLQKIPLQADTTDQSVTIELGGSPYIIDVTWNERGGYFSLSISTVDNEPILTGVKMVKNYPLTARYKNDLLPSGVFYFLQERGNAYRPTYDDLGTSFGLYYYEPDVTAPTSVVISASNVQIGTVWDAGFTSWDGGATAWDQ